MAFLRAWRVFQTVLQSRVRPNSLSRPGARVVRGAEEVHHRLLGHLAPRKRQILAQNIVRRLQWVQAGGGGSHARGVDSRTNQRK